MVMEKNYERLKEVLIRIFKICRRRNIMLNPSKFFFRNRVEFGGSVNEYSISRDRIEISPSHQKIEELMGRKAQD